MRARYIASMAFGLAGSLAAGVAFGTAVNDQSAQDKEPGAASQAISASVRLAEVPDPEGRAPWVMQLYRTDDTEQCYVYGQVRDGKVGNISEGDGFTPVPIEAGHCYAPTRSRSLNVKLDTNAELGRIILHGLVGSDVRQLTVHTPRGSFAARPRANGALLLVTEGEGPSGARVSATFADGSSASILEPPPASVPPPSRHQGPVGADHSHE